MSISINDAKVGSIIKYKGQLFNVLKTMHTQPGKGGAYIQIEMKDIMNGTKLDIRFRSGEMVEKPHLQPITCQYLYPSGNMLVVMAKDTYEQIEIPKNIINESQRPFLVEGMNIKVDLCDNQPIIASLPDTIEAKIVDCEPSIKGQTASSSFKPATLENGIKIMVAQFVSIGDTVIVNTLDHTYLKRVN